MIFFHAIISKNNYKITIICIEIMLQVQPQENKTTAVPTTIIASDENGEVSKNSRIMNHSDTSVNENLTLT